jgi:predicted Zn-dependent protease
MTVHHIPDSLATEQRDLLKVLAHTYLQYGLAEKAAVLLHAIYAVDPSDSHVVKSLAYAYVNSDRPHDAMLLLDTLLGAGNPGQEVFLLRSLAYTRMGRRADAARSMRYFIGARSGLTESGLQ